MDGNLRTILFVFGALVALFTFLFHTRLSHTQRTTSRALRDDPLKLESERRWAAARLGEPPTVRYSKTLDWGLRRMQGLFGPAFSARAWGEAPGQ